LTARAKIATCKKEKGSLELEKKQIEIGQQRYTPAAHGHKKLIDSVKGMVEREFSLYRDSSYVAAVGNAKVMVLENYISDRNKGATVQEAIETIKRNVRNVEYIDDAVQTFDEILGKGVDEARELRNRMEGGYVENDASKKIKNNVNEARAEDTEFMAKFTKEYCF
jgi:hypothetical protein